MQEISAQLLVEFYDWEDWPSEHRCTKDGRHVCQHDVITDRAPLLDRLDELVMPGAGKIETSAPAPRSGPKAGSPAPWDPSAGELIDEIHRGALELLMHVRAALGLPAAPQVRELVRPRGWHPPFRLVPVLVRLDRLPVDVAGRRALRDLPTFTTLLERKHPLHHLVLGPPVSRAHPERGFRPGEVLATLRRWRHRALIITGHEQRPVILHQWLNRWHDEWHRGPLCELADAALSCSHRSCEALRDSRGAPLWTTCGCPYCGTRGLHLDEINSSLFCPRPSCRDEDGARREWSTWALRQIGLTKDTE